MWGCGSEILLLFCPKEKDNRVITLLIHTSIFSFYLKAFLQLIKRWSTAVTDTNKLINAKLSSYTNLKSFLTSAWLSKERPAGVRTTGPGLQCPSWGVGKPFIASGSHLVGITVLILYYKQKKNKNRNGQRHANKCWLHLSIDQTLKPFLYFYFGRKEMNKLTELTCCRRVNVPLYN